MLWVQECRQYVQGRNITDRQVEQLPDQLYQCATLCVEQNLSSKGQAHGDRKTD